MINLKDRQVLKKKLYLSYCSNAVRIWGINQMVTIKIQ